MTASRLFQRVLFGMLILLSACGRLTGPDLSTPQKAFDAYVQALDQKNLPSLKRTMHNDFLKASEIERLENDPLNWTMDTIGNGTTIIQMMLNQRHGLYCPAARSLRVIDADAQDGAAIVVVEHVARDRTPLRGLIEIRQSGGSWRVFDCRGWTADPHARPAADGYSWE